LDKQKLQSYLGFALRAGLCAKGSEAVLLNIRNQKADVVLLDRDAAYNTKKQIANACHTYNVRLIEVDEDLLFHVTKQNFKTLAIKASPLSEQIKQL